MRLVDEALEIAKHHGYRQLIPQFQRICRLIPAGAD